MVRVSWPGHPRKSEKKMTLRQIKLDVNMHTNIYSNLKKNINKSHNMHTKFITY